VYIEATAAQAKGRGGGLAAPNLLLGGFFEIIGLSWS
jgi:hypothetical protein